MDSRIASRNCSISKLFPRGGNISSLLLNRFQISFIVFSLILLFFCSPSSISFTKKDFSNNQLLCPALLSGFEFISSNKVKVINTDLNKITTINEYYYDVDLELSYINIFSSENSIRDRVYSIELNSLRVDVWTMTGGGFTTREMFPIGNCEFVQINNFLSHIDSLK